MRLPPRGVHSPLGGALTICPHKFSPSKFLFFAMGVHLHPLHPLATPMSHANPEIRTPDSGSPMDSPWWGSAVSECCCIQLQCSVRKVRNVIYAQLNISRYVRSRQTVGDIVYCSPARHSLHTRRIRRPLA